MANLLFNHIREYNMQLRNKIVIIYVYGKNTHFTKMLLPCSCKRCWKGCIITQPRIINFSNEKICEINMLFVPCIKSMLQAHFHILVLPFTSLVIISISWTSEVQNLFYNQNYHVLVSVNKEDQILILIVIYIYIF